MSYQIEQKSIVHEVVDGEVVIINFANGRYYSLVGVSAFIWEILSSGPKAKEDLILELVEAYNVKQENVTTDLDIFLGKLVSEGLTRVVEVDPVSYNPTSKSAQNKKPYLSPELVIQSDMAHVIMLDPVHELVYLK